MSECSPEKKQTPKTKWIKSRLNHEGLLILWQTSHDSYMAWQFKKEITQTTKTDEALQFHCSYWMRIRILTPPNAAVWWPLIQSWEFKGPNPPLFTPQHHPPKKKLRPLERIINNHSALIRPWRCGSCFRYTPKKDSQPDPEKIDGFGRGISGFNEQVFFEAIRSSGNLVGWFLLPGICWPNKT